MAEQTLVDNAAFVPLNGGWGVRIACSTSPSAPVGIPGAGSIQNIRVMVTNDGAVTAFIRLGQGDHADINSLPVLAGTQVVYTVPYAHPNGLTISGITEAATTNISAHAGLGF